ncbi:hypothetical protein HY489_05310 [Candidatus Woesearchaeota archaeon]|nr:hypothetical protein [Candidatus Woesearchaeota archaeon]
MAKDSESKLFAFLGVFLSIIGFIIVMLTRKSDRYAMYYAKQGLVLFILAVAVSIIGSLVPVIGWFIILPIGNLIVLVLWIIGIVNSLSGQMKPIPLIGKYAEKLNL